MGQNSKIEWTHHTFNAWVGCAKVSPGCKNCYAETLMDHRYGKVKWGPNGTRVRTGPANWAKVKQWNDKRWMCPECGKWSGSSGTCGATLMKTERNYGAGGEFIGLHSVPRPCKGEREFIARPRVFCASLADVFEDRPELVEWRADLFALIEATPNLDWLLLTKRPENILGMWDGRGIVHRNRPNVWIGTSVEDQAAADERIPALMRVAHLSRFIFLSMEPLLGPVDLRMGRAHNPPQAPGAINWVIVGGESGPSARPMHPAWVRGIRDQCAAHHLPFLFKQWGEWAPCGPVRSDPSFDGGAVVAAASGGTVSVKALVKRNKGVQLEYDTVLERVGKHKAGRLLDGVEHNGFPG